MVANATDSQTHAIPQLRRRHQSYTSPPSSPPVSSSQHGSLSPSAGDMGATEQRLRPSPSHNEQACGHAVTGRFEVGRGGNSSMHGWDTDGHQLGSLQHNELGSPSAGQPRSPLAPSSQQEYIRIASNDSIGSDPMALPRLQPLRARQRTNSTSAAYDNDSDDNSPLLAGRPSSSPLPRRWLHRSQSADRNWSLGLLSPSQAADGGTQHPVSTPRQRSSLSFGLSSQHVSAAEAAVEGQLTDRLLRQQGFLHSGSHQDDQLAVSGSSASGLQTSQPAADGRARAAYMNTAGRQSFHTAARAKAASFKIPQVVEHPVAGDLFISQTPRQPPSTAFDQRPDSPVKAPNKLKSSPSRVRHSFARRASLVDRQAPFSDESDAESDILKEDDLRDDVGTVKVKWRHRTAVRRALVIIPIILSVLLTVVGIVLVVAFRGRYALYFDAWRWCFFFAAFVPIYWLSRFVLHLLVLVVEAKLFTNAKLLFFLLSVRKNLGRFLRCVVWLPVFAALFGPASNRGQGVRTVYFTILRLLGCVALFWFANIIKTLIARSISSHFHQEAHFKKMRQALEQEAILAALSQPRQEHRVDDQLLESAKTTEHGKLDALSPEQLAELRAEREASRRIAPLAVISSAVLGPQATKRRSSPSLSSSSLQRAATCPEEVPSPHDFGTNDALGPHPPRIRTKLNGLHDDAPTIEAIHEEDEMPQSVISPSQASRRSSLERGGLFRTKTPKRSSLEKEGLSKTTTPRLSSMENGGSSMEDGGAEKKPKKAFVRALTRLRETQESYTPSERSAAAQPKASNKTQNKSLEHKVSLPGGAASELEVVMKLHTIERHIRKNKLKVTLSDEIGAASRTGGQELSSSAQARRLAFYLFWNIKADFTRSYIVQEDIEHFLPAHKAAKAFAMFDNDGDGRVTLHNARDAVIRVYEERKDLAMTLKDTKGVVNRLEFLIAVVVHILFFFLYLLIFRVNVNRVWLTISSIMLAFAFVFGNSIRNVFESVVFLFVVHPYDVGDALMVTDPTDPGPGAQYYKVEEIMLLNTKVKRWDGAVIYFPNNVLDSNPLVNLSRSDKKWEVFKLWCDIGTPAASFDQLRERIKEYLDAEGEFSGEFAAIVVAAGDPMKIQLGIFFEFSFNGSNLGRISKARHEFYVLLCAQLTGLNIRFTMPNFPQHSGLTVPGRHQQLQQQEAIAAAGDKAMISGAAAVRAQTFF